MGISLKNICLILFLIIAGFSAHSQEFPVALNSTITPPYPIYKEDIVNNNTWLANMTFKDFNEASREVFLNISIESDLLHIRTNKNAIGLPVYTLIPGVPVQLSSFDFEQYLLSSNTFVNGSFASQYNSTARFPEGMYEFCVEVIDKHTGKTLSQKSCSQLWIQLNDQPIINNPFCGQVVDPETTTNIFFQWQLFGNMSPNSIMSTEYQFTLYEITSGVDLDPQSAIYNGQVIRQYQSEWLTNTTLIYDLSYPTLTKGKRYAWQVQVHDNNGRDVFKNNGYSEACWFSYGYPEGGKIELNYPENNSGYAKTDLQYFNWSGPDNMLDNQYVEYEISIKEVADGQDVEIAFNSNDIWHYYHTERLYQDEGFDLTIDKSQKRFVSGQKYCWKVEAYTGDQKIAESEVYSFIGPPFLESFYVDLYEVEVTKLFNNDMHDLKGEGRLIVTEDQQKADISFENIGLVNIAGRYYLETGVVESELDHQIQILLNPDNYLNESAYANIHRIKLSKDDGFMAQAVVNWEFILPLKEGDRQVIFSDSWFLYDYYRLSGISSPDHNYNFKLLEPEGFDLQLNSSSEFIVRENQYEAIFDGEVTLPNNVLNQGEYLVSYSFSNQDQLYYMEEVDVSAQPKIEAFKPINVTLEPKSYIFDFSDFQSPFAFPDDYWKGFFPTTYNFIFEHYSGYDATINFNESLEYLLDQVPNANTNFSVDQYGLNFKIENEQFTNSENGLTFNTFPANLYDFSLNIERSNFESGDMHGGILIPVISEIHEFPFEVPFNFMGYTDGYLTEDIEGQQFTFNSNGGDQKMFIDINRAVFREKNHLEMDLDIAWPNFGVQMNGVDYFCVWGNYDIGFVEPNGSIALKEQIFGMASGYDITMEYIGAGRTANLYSIGSKATIMMGENIAGDDGPPTINAYSIMESSIIPDDYVASYSSSFEYDPNDEDLFSTNTGSGMDIEDEYENDIRKLLYEFENNLPSSDSNSTSSATFSPTFANGNILDEVSIQELIESIDMLIELLGYVADESQKQKLEQIRALLVGYDQSGLADILRDIQKNGLDINQIIQGQIQRLVDKLNGQIIAKVNIINGKIKEIVYIPVEAIMDPFNMLIEKTVGAIIDELEPLVSDNQVALQILSDARISVVTRVNDEFNGAVYGSVDSNIVFKLTGSVNTIVTDNITNFISSEAVNLGGALLTKPGESPQEFQQLLTNAEGLLQDMGDDLIQELSTVNGQAIKNTAKNVVEDAYDNIDWNVIAEGIKSDMMASIDDVTKALITDAIANLFDGGGGLAAGIAAGVLANVELDFTDLGSKLKEGDLSGIVKFDPTKIIVKSEVAEFEGMLEFKKDDPTWGDSWQAEIDGKVLKPKTFTAHAYFLNGKVNDYTYWFLELAVPSGLGVAIAPTIVMDGINGKVFHHMKYESNTKVYLPDPNTKFGIGVGAFLVDGVPGEREALGKTARLDVGLELAIQENHFTMDIRGMVGMGWNKNLDDGTDFSRCFATGDGFIGYNSQEEHLLGEFTVTTNTSPLLCAGGTMGLSIKQNDWNVYIGKKQTPVYAKLLCKDFAMFEAWFDLSNTRFEAGFHKHIDIHAKSPWFTVVGKEVQPFAGFGYDFLAETAMQLKPKFKLEEATLSMSAYAAIGSYYKKKENGETVIKEWVLAGANISGSGKYVNNDQQSYISAILAGDIKICGVGIGVHMDVYKVLTNE